MPNPRHRLSLSTGIIFGLLVSIATSFRTSGSLRSPLRARPTTSAATTCAHDDGNTPPRLGALGIKLETPEEYMARREAAVTAFGGIIEKPETPAQYMTRRNRLQREWESRQAKRQLYDDLRAAPLPGQPFSEVKNGDRLEGSLVSELRKGAHRGEKAFFDCGVWRRRAGDGLPVKVNAMVRLSREDIFECQYFENDKERPQRLYVTDAQHSSGRIVASFTPPGTLKSGRRAARPLLSAELKPGEHLLDDIEPCTCLKARVLQMTSIAAWVEVPVVRRSAKDGLLRRVNARLHTRDLPSDTVLATTIVRAEDVTTVIRRGEELVVYVQAVHPASGKIEVRLEESGGASLEADASRKIERRRESRRRNRRSKATRAMFAAAEAGTDDVRASRIRDAEVVGVKPFGLLVDFGGSFPGLVHISDVARSNWNGRPSDDEVINGRAHIDNLAALVPVGQLLKVRVKPLGPPVESGGQSRLSFEVVKWLGDAPSAPGYWDEEAEDIMALEGGDDDEGDDAGDDEDDEEEEEDLESKWEDMYY